MSKPASKEAKYRWIELSVSAKSAFQLASLREASDMVLTCVNRDRDVDWEAAYWVGIRHLEVSLGLVETGMVGADEYDEIIKAQDLMEEI